MPEVKMTVYVTNYDEEGNPTDGTWYYPGDDMPDEVAETIDNEAVWGNGNSGDHMGQPTGYAASQQRASGLPHAVSSGYEDWTVEEMKTELRNRELPTTGHKAELQQRLVENDGELAAAEMRT